jgi:hypothetical protein
LVLDPLEHAVFDEVVETLGDEVPGGAGVDVELLEPGRTEERLPQQQQRPPVTYDRQGAGDRAAGVADLGPTHDLEGIAFRIGTLYVPIRNYGGARVDGCCPVVEPRQYSLPQLLGSPVQLRLEPTARSRLR